MADKKISALTGAATPLDGTEVLPIVQSGSTVKVANNDLRPKQIQSNATSGVLQIAGPAAAATRVMTTPDANFTAARTDAAQTFTGLQTFNGGLQAPSGQKALFGTTGFTAEVYYNANGNLSLSPRTGYNTQLDAGNLIPAVAGKGVNFTANTPAAGMTSQLLNWYEEGTWTPALSASGATFGYDAQLGRYTRTGNVVVVQGRIALNNASGGSGAVTLTGLPFTSAATMSGYAVGQQGIIGRAASFAGDFPSTLEVNSSSTTANIYYRAASNSGSVQLDFSDVGSAADFLFTIVYQAA